MSNRLPFAATAASARYDGLPSLPVAVLLDNVRSMYNVGAFFRTMDAASAGPLLLCGITAAPPKREISKTALGAEDHVAWEHSWDAPGLATAYRCRGYEIAAIETSARAVDLFDWVPRFPVCVLFGHETEGLQPDLAATADTFIRIPMLGMKHSLNVATAGGVVLFELLRKFRNLHHGPGPR